MRSFKHCFSCGAADLTPFYEQRGVPVNSCLMMPTKAEALSFPRGDIRLGFCRACGFIQNLVFDASRLEYSSRYEESQGFSPRFNQFAADLAQRLIQRYELHGKEVMEIGCGKGDFLTLLCQLGNNKGLGIDPTYISERTSAELADRVRFITDFYSEQYVNLCADFIACRHTLEHVQPVQDFVKLVRQSIGERRDPVVFFEVPDVGRVLKELAFWDIYYEHCSYFSLGSLARLFRRSEFDLFDLRKDYDDQYLLLEAVAANGSEGPYWESEEDLGELESLVGYFGKHHGAKLNEWARSLQRIRDRGERAVLWGSSSKAVAYLTSLGIKDEVEFVVDVNPFRQGKFLAGSGHEIVAPDFLREYKPDAVIAMNPIYLDEIRADLDRLGVKAELSAV